MFRTVHGTCGRNDEKMCSITNRRYFRRHGCPSGDLCRGSHCDEKYDCHTVALRASSDLSQSADCQSVRSSVWSEPSQKTHHCPNTTCTLRTLLVSTKMVVEQSGLVGTKSQSSQVHTTHMLRGTWTSHANTADRPRK